MKKKLLTAAVLVMCAVALVVGSVLTTMALLTSSVFVTNSFTIGDVSITMDEAKVNEDGQLIPDATSRVTANTYHLIPGKTYIKDPTIHITSGANNDMYLFVKSRNEIRSAEEGNFVGANAVPAADAKKTMREQMEANGWVEFVRSGDGVEIVWVYGTRDTATGKITPTPVNGGSTQLGKNGQPVGVAAGSFRLCENFTIHEDATVGMYSSAEVKFTAFAVQELVTSAQNHALTKAVWDAIKSAYPYDVSIIAPVNPYSGLTGENDAYAPVEDVENPLPVLPGTPGTSGGTDPNAPTTP